MQSLKRACPHCEQEQGILDRSDASKTHGICKRHFIAILREGKIPERDIQAAINNVESGGGWCPDLSQGVHS